MSLSEAEGERAVDIAVAGDDPPGAPTHAQIAAPLRAFVATTSTLPDRRNRFYDATVTFTPDTGFLVKLLPLVTIDQDVHHFLLIGYKIAFELLC